MICKQFLNMIQGCRRESHFGWLQAFPKSCSGIRIRRRSRWTTSTLPFDPGSSIRLTPGDRVPEKFQSICYQPSVNKRSPSSSTKAVRSFLHHTYESSHRHTSAGNFQQLFGSVVALPAVVEKGYLDVHLSVASPGGHSSIPPKHTVRATLL